MVENYRSNPPWVIDVDARHVEIPLWWDLISKYFKLPITLKVFAHYEVVDHLGQRLIEGHKASFCLEDNDCDHRVDPVYDCENYGDQGITAGCKDIYHANIDCQWIDVTELPTGTYTFKVSINPEYKVLLCVALQHRIQIIDVGVDKDQTFPCIRNGLLNRQ